MSPVLLSRWSALVGLLLLGSGATTFADVLAIAKTGPGGVKPGDEATYTIVASNTGPGDILGVALDDPTPSGLSLVSVSGDCATFPCTFATLASGATKTVTARFSVPLGYNGPNPIVNTAVARPAAGDAVAATASTAVLRVAGFHTLPPCRIVDTRLNTGVPIGGPALAGGAIRTANVREACGLPGNAIAISFNITVTGPTSAGDLRISPGGTSVPSSSINYVTGQTRANNGIVPLSGAGTLSVQCDQATGTTDLILDVNGYFASTDEVATPVGQNVHVRPAPEVAITFDNVTQAGVTTARILEFADNRSGAVDQDLKLFFPAGSAERALVPSAIVPSFIKPLGKGGPAGTPTFVLSIISTTAKFTRTAEFHGFEDFRLGWDPPCVVSADPTQEPRTFYAREAPKGEPDLVEEMAFGGPVFVDISSGCGSNKGSGWNFSLYLTARDTRTPHDVALYMLSQMQVALSSLGPSLNPALSSTLQAQIQAATTTLDSAPASSLGSMTNVISIVDNRNPVDIDDSTRNVSGELVGRALSASYMIRKLMPPTGIIAEFIVPTASSQPYEITTGPDGNLWFTELIGGKIGRITPAGAITEFVVPVPTSRPNGITAGPDGNLWFTELSGNKIGRITTSGTITEFPVPGIGALQGITAGPDGNLWFAEQDTNKIGRITPAGVITEFAVPTTGSNPFGIAPGPDGNLWFTERSGNKIGRITPAGTITEFSVPTPPTAPCAGCAVVGPLFISAGPDGNVWFTEPYGGKIGRTTSAGAITEFTVPTRFPVGITAGPDGNLWFAEQGPAAKIGRITPAGSITEFPIPTADSGPYGITSGPDGDLWFTETSQTTGNKIGRITP